MNGVDRGRQLYKKKLQENPIEFVWVIIFIAGIITYLIIVLYIDIFIKFSSDDYNVKKIFFNMCLGILIYLAYKKIKRTIRPFRYQVFENGFVYPDDIIELKKEDNFISYDDINEISFHNYGLSTKLKHQEGIIINIMNGDGEKPYLLIVNALVKKFDLKDYPDYTVFEKWNSYKTKVERKSAMMRHIEKNKRFA